jgi:hypothetical protein
VLLEAAAVQHLLVLRRPLSLGTVEETVAVVVVLALALVDTPAMGALEVPALVMLEQVVVVVLGVALCNSDKGGLQPVVEVRVS